MIKKTYILFFLLVFLFSSCIPARYTETRLSITGESTIPVTLIIYADQQPDWGKVFTFLESRSRLYDHRIQGSPVHTLNTSYQAHVPEEIMKVMTIAINIAEKSSGAFDPTILPLTRLWNFDNNPSLPDAADISSAKALVDYTQVALLKNNMIRIPERFGIDLGGIAKGALVDTLADHLNTLGYNEFLIEAGGDILISGLKPVNKKWIIGIIHPRDKKDRLGDLSLGTENGRIAVVTSGDYEKYFEHNGKKYHHIIDPHTGYPANDLVSVTLIAPTCTEADALATAVFVLGSKKGIALLEGRENTEGLLMYEDTEGLHSVMTEGFSVFFNNK